MEDWTKVSNSGSAWSEDATHKGATEEDGDGVLFCRGMPRFQSPLKQWEGTQNGNGWSEIWSMLLTVRCHCDDDILKLAGETCHQIWASTLMKRKQIETLVMPDAMNVDDATTDASHQTSATADQFCNGS